MIVVCKCSFYEQNNNHGEIVSQDHAQSSLARQADPHYTSLLCSSQTLQIQLLLIKSKWNKPEEAEEEVEGEAEDVVGDVVEDVAEGLTREEPKVVEF